MLNRTKKSVQIACLGLTIVLSGVAGYTGTYLANKTKNNVTAVYVNRGNEFNSTLLSTGSASSTAAQNSLTINQIYKLTSASVVEISTETVTTSTRMRQFVSEGAGSGVIATKDGYIITNNHVIDGANKITVRTTDKKTYPAKLIGRDEKTDLAVIKIDSNNLQPAVYGDSSKLYVGELSVVIGNPLGELGGTVTDGIISALNRDINIDGKTMNLLQTSAAVNPGNSGGALFNDKGELCGIVNAKPNGSDIEGIGFAIPINTVKPIINSLMKYGYVQGRIDTGLTLLDISDTQTAIAYRVQYRGVYVKQVSDISSDFKAGDRIISVDGTQINSVNDFENIIDKHKVGDSLKVVVDRGYGKGEISLKLKQASK